jgi:excisionase family DNA binding protein
MVAQQQDSPLLTAEEAALFLRISEPMVYLLVKREGLPVVRVGRRVLFLRESVINWLKQKEER